MSRNRSYTRTQRTRAINRKRKIAFSLFGCDYFEHIGSYSKGKTRVWRCARDRAERPLDKRELIALTKMDEQIQDI